MTIPRTLTLFSLCTVLAACDLEPRSLGHPEPSTEGVVMTHDVVVAEALAAELRFDPGVASEDIQVTELDGAVTLMGTVPYLAARDRASLLARAMKGVVIVNNRLVVKPPAELDDETISAAVAQALEDHPATHDTALEVTVKDGVVTVTGVVDSWHEERLVEHVAASISGVRGLLLQVEHRPTIDRSDATILADIEGMLAWDPRIEESLVGVRVDDAEVHLSGMVGTLAERDRVLTRAWAAGVRDVHAESLTVRGWAKDPFVRPPGARSLEPADAAKALRTALLLDPRVSVDELEIAVVGRSLTVRGVVPSLAARDQALELASRTVGVDDVVDGLTLDTEQPLTGLEDTAMAALQRDGLLTELDLEVQLEGELLVLSGEVPDQYTHDRALDIVSAIIGVRQVRDELEVVDDA